MNHKLTQNKAMKSQIDMNYVKPLARHIAKYYQLYLLLLPAVIVIFLFNYLPIYGIQLAFREFRPLSGVAGGEFVGLKYFTRFINSYQFSPLIRNTVRISFFTLVFSFPLPIIMALIFNQIKNKKRQNFVQTVAYMPHFISIVVMVGMLQIFLSPTNGLYAQIIRLFGMMPINPMGEQSYFVPIYVLSDLWQHAGWNSIIYIAALSGVDTQLYDAADVDGVNKWQKIWYIEIPFILPTIVILLILNAGNIMNVGFEKVFLMQNSLNSPVSSVISTYVYEIGLIHNQYSYSAAIGLLNTIINFSLLVFVNLVARKTGKISLW